MNLGCRPLSLEEIDLIISHLNLRDATLVTLGLKTGFRVSELLSLRVKDVYQFGKILNVVSVSRKHMKGSKAGRKVPLHSNAKIAIENLIVKQNLTHNDYLFQSRKGTNQPITRIQAYRALKMAAAASNLTGAIAMHSLRKSFCEAVYKALNGDLVKTQKAMGHKSISSTVSYISFLETDIDDAILL